MIKIHLSSIMGAKRINQSELSKKTGIRPNTINELYHELADRVRLDHIEAICRALECDIADLFEIKDEK